jgi:hypothetical protein
MPIEAVSRELLVRYLDTWVPAALHGGRRATFAQVWLGSADAEAAEAALRVFAEFGDQIRGRRLTVLHLATDLGDLPERTARVQAEPATPPDLAVHAMAGDPAAALKPALSAAQSAGAPLLVYAEGDVPPAWGSSSALPGKPVELLLATDPGQRVDLDAPLTCAVDLVNEDSARRFHFATRQMKHLEAFKNAMWQLDEYAGVRIRDPHDAEGMLLDISLKPGLAPLRRELTAHLNEAGSRTVTEIKQFALTGTVYRAEDVTGALHALLTSGAVRRDPEHGRLGGDTLISAA